MTGPATWVLVSNGVRARILRGLEGSGAGAPAELVSLSRSSHLRDLIADKAGRTFSSDRSGRRSAMEPRSDPILRDMEDFARELLGTLDMHRRAGDFERVVIVAAPKMLGILRAEMPRALARLVACERAANLIHVPESELRAAVRALLNSEAEH